MSYYGFYGEITDNILFASSSREFVFQVWSSGALQEIHVTYFINGIYHFCNLNTSAFKNLIETPEYSQQKNHLSFLMLN